jgi:hypothetical protein
MDRLATTEAAKRFETAQESPRAFQGRSWSSGVADEIVALQGKRARWIAWVLTGLYSAFANPVPECLEYWMVNLISRDGGIGDNSRAAALMAAPPLAGRLMPMGR